jgi:hypothetical protein
LGAFFLSFSEIVLCVGCLVTVSSGSGTFPLAPSAGAGLDEKLLESVYVSGLTGGIDALGVQTLLSSVVATGIID